MLSGLKRMALPLGGMIVPITNDAVFPMIPRFQESYGLSLAAVNGIVPSMMLPFAAMMLFAGAITARFGRRRMLIAGFGGLALGSVLILIAPYFSVVLVGRVVQGLGAAFVMPAIIAAIGDAVEPDLRGRTMGLFMISITVGAALGPAIGGWLSEWGGIPGVACFLAGIAIFFALYYAAILDPDRAGLVARHEVREALRSALLNPNVIGIGITGATVFIALMGSMTFSASMLARAPFNLGPGAVGNVLAIGLGAGIIGAIAGGACTDRRGRTPTTVLGFAVMGIGGVTVGMAALWPEALGLAGVVVGLAGLGLGHAIAMTALETLSVEVMPHNRDAATSLFNALRFSGYGIAPPLAAYIFGFLGNAAPVYFTLTGVLGVGTAYFLLFVSQSLNELMGGTGSD